MANQYSPSSIAPMPPRKAHPDNSTERSIYFYRIDVGSTASGKPIAFDATGILAKLKKLTFPGTSPTDNYWDDGNEALTCSWVDDPDTFPRMRLAMVRRNGLPLMESSGTLSPLRIPVTAGLAEQIHIVFFPGNVIGADFNFHGPRPTRLGPYLRAKNLLGQMSVQPLLRHDALREFDQLRTLRVFKMRIHRNYIAKLENADPTLGEAFQALLNIGNSEEAEIVLKAAPGKDGTLGKGLLGSVRRILRRDTDVARSDSGVAAFQVRGQSEKTHRIETVDLLSDRFVVRKRLVLEDGRHRVVQSASAYAAIKDAYGEISDELPRLSTVSI